MISLSRSKYRLELLNLLWTMAEQPETRISYGSLFETSVHEPTTYGKTV